MSKNVYQCIAEVSAALATEGIGKHRQADTFGDKEGGKKGFKFRGIDDVHNALAPHLARAGLVILPHVKKRALIERASKYGNPLFSVCVHVEYTLASSHDGSTALVTIVGEAMDSGDKATNKAMSIAYKYMAIQTFCIPVVGADDPDETIYEVAPSQKYRRDQASAPKHVPKAEQPPKAASAKPEPKQAPKPGAPKTMTGADALARLASYADTDVESVYRTLSAAGIRIPEHDQEWERSSLRVVEMAFTVQASRPFERWLTWAAKAVAEGQTTPDPQTAPKPHVVGRRIYQGEE